MENASKALIIAGSILISIIIISLGVLVFTRMSSSVKDNTDLDEQAIASFNAELTPYIGKKIAGAQVNALIQRVISIDNLAKKNNDTNKRVTIKKDSQTGQTIVGLGDDNKLITSNKMETGKYYEVNGITDSSGLITTIVVKEN